jgi:hypothetical protein
MRGARYTHNIGNDPFGNTLFLVRQDGRWMLQQAGGEPIHLSDEQIRLMADVAGVAKAAGR